MFVYILSIFYMGSNTFSKDASTSSIWMPFIPISSSLTVIKKRNESNPPCAVLVLRHKAFSLSPDYDINC